MSTPETPGAYLMTVAVSVDDHGILYPHDTGEMFLAAWWAKHHATFVSVEDHGTILAGRRAAADETERLRARSQELQAEVNHLKKLLDERDATDRASLRAPFSTEDTPAAPEPRVWREGDDPGPDRLLLADAVSYVTRTQHGAHTAIQRNVRVGYAKAGRLLDLLESWGVVGPAKGSAARKVLITAEQGLDLYHALSEVASPDATGGES